MTNQSPRALDRIAEHRDDIEDLVGRDDLGEVPRYAEALLALTEEDR